MNELQRPQLLDHLWELQRTHRHIRDQDIQSLAAALDISAIDLEGVVSFYHFFHRQPAGAVTIYVDDSIVAQHAGAEAVLQAFSEATGAPVNGVSPDGAFGLFRTPCIGLSDQAPAALIDFHPFTRLTPEKVRRIVQELQSGKRPAEICDRVEESIRYLPPNDQTVFFRPFTPGRALAQAAAVGAEAVVETIKKSGLSGRGGAFFPAWIKWNACKQADSAQKYVVCNADEGEPGTFKDRILLHQYPDAVLEGMLVAGYTIGADQGILYLRGEYTWLLPDLQRAIEQYRAAGLLGKNAGGLPGFDFDIRIQLGAGAYICGEETALLESLEGKRGEPRTKWYFPVEKGYLQQPTLIHNVETLAAAAHLLDLGLEAYASRGLPDEPGFKLLSVSGDCARPGIYEAPWGMPVSELLALCGAEDPLFVQLSGPSGELIAPSEFHRRISMRDAPDTLRCGGAFTVFSQKRDLLQALLNYAHFFKHESCGVCTPCRAGNFILQRKLEKLDRGLAQATDLADIRHWGELMRASSRCGLGKTAPNAPMQALEQFPDYFAARLSREGDDLTRAFDLDRAVAEYDATIEKLHGNYLADRV